MTISNLRRLVRSAPALALVWAVVALVFGVATIATQPVGATSDTWAHVYRIDALLNGELLAHPVDAYSEMYNTEGTSYGGAVDWELVRLSDTCADRTSVARIDTITRFDDTTADVPFNGAAIYSPLSYLPYLGALALARLLGLSALASYYIMLVAGLAAFVALVALGIALLPRWHVAAALFFATPLSLMLATSISADCMAFASLALFSCLLLRCLVERPGRRALWGLAVLGVVVAASKLAYAPLVVAPVALLLVHPRLKGRLVSVGGAIVAFASVLAWSQISGDIATSPNLVSWDEASARTQSLLADPTRPLHDILWTIATLQTYRLEFSLAHSAVALGTYLGIVVTLALFVASMVRRWTRPRTAAFWLVCLLLTIACIVLVLLALYLQYDPEGTPGIIGIQPRRYYWPVLPLVLFAFLECLLAWQLAHKARVTSCTGAPETMLLDNSS
ncbi:MAG: DUF2142 domain-containing protein [Coriobacteriales bacterium]|nr:DUF2142 domain-containing protein [Coriobacteriales bacterium]